MRTPLLAKLFPFLYSLLGDPVYNARARVHDAMKDVCTRESQATYHRSLHVYFAEEAEAIDPHQDWNRFAELKNAWQDEWNNLMVADRRVSVARAKLDARRKQLTKLESASS
jgi:hypothetical protein